MSKDFGLKSLIPSGNELRTLLNSKHISEGEINTTLKSKGIFCGNSDKVITVPILSATLLTSDEYSNILEKSIDRSLKPKNKAPEKLELVDSTSDWATPLKKLELNPFENIPNIKTISEPRIIFVDKNKVNIKYKIERNDFSKDFLNRSLEFEASVSIEQKDGQVYLECQSTHTSAETELINRRISTAIAKELNRAGVITSEVAERLTFKVFEDAERVRFFKRLTGGLGADIKLDNVNEIIISREASTADLPNDPEVSWMNKTVKSMRIDGEKLHDIFLLSNERYYEYYYIHRMNLSFKYALGNNSGTFKVSFFFSSSSRSKSKFDDEAELTYSIDSINPETSMTVAIKREVTDELTEKVQEIIRREYEKILSERKPDNSPNKS